VNVRTQTTAINSFLHLSKDGVGFIGHYSAFYEAAIWNIKKDSKLTVVECRREY
jgi:hypothetical protein